MYDPTLTVARVGFEAQYRLAVDPRVLVFDPSAKKLGVRFDPAAVDLIAPMPSGWSWSADPCPGSLYLPHDAPLHPRDQKWFITDHAQRFAGSVGFDSYRVWRDNPRVVCQLELRSRPLSVAALSQDLRPARDAFHEAISEMLELGVAGVIGDPTRQQAFNEQVSLELVGDTPTHPVRVLGCLALGLWALLRHREALSPEQPGIALLLQHLDQVVAHSRSLPARYDLISNAATLLDAQLDGRLPTSELVRWLTGPAHIALLTQNLDNRFCDFLVHGLLPISAQQLAEVRPAQLDTLRGVGVDSVFLDVWADRPQPHLSDDLLQRYDPAFLRQGLRRFCQLDHLDQLVRATILGEGGYEPEERISLPLFHLRKTLAPGRIYLELRCLDSLRAWRHPRYPYQYRRVPYARKKALRLHDCAHLHHLGLDLARVIEIALLIGDDLRADLLAGDGPLSARDATRLRDRVVQMADTMFRFHQPPCWTWPDSSAGSALIPVG